jgi:hypothetical protein
LPKFRLESYEMAIFQQAHLVLGISFALHLYYMTLSTDLASQVPTLLTSLSRFVARFVVIMIGFACPIELVAGSPETSKATCAVLSGKDAASGIASIGVNATIANLNRYAEAAAAAFPSLFQKLQSLPDINLIGEDGKKKIADLDGGRTLILFQAPDSSNQLLKSTYIANPEVSLRLYPYEAGRLYETVGRGADTGLKLQRMSVESEPVPSLVWASAWVAQPDRWTTLNEHFGFSPSIRLRTSQFLALVGIRYLKVQPSELKSVVLSGIMNVDTALEYNGQLKQWKQKHKREPRGDDWLEIVGDALLVKRAMEIVGLIGRKVQSISVEDPYRESRTLDDWVTHRSSPGQHNAMVAKAKELGLVDGDPIYHSFNIVLHLAPAP